MNAEQEKIDSKCFNCGLKFEDKNEFQKHVFVCNGSSSENMAEKSSIDILKSTTYSRETKKEADLTSNFDIVDKSEKGLSLLILQCNFNIFTKHCPQSLHVKC